MSSPFTRALCSLVFLLTSFSLARAGGSIELADIQRLLQQQPELWSFFSNGLDIESHGSASRLSGPDYKELRGTRVGPYLFRAKPKTSGGGYVFELRVTTDISWLDAEGKQVGPENATRVKETVEGVELRPLTW